VRCEKNFPGLSFAACVGDGLGFATSLFAESILAAVVFCCCFVGSLGAFMYIHAMRSTKIKTKPIVV
jgi:hypothetical protein